MRGKKRKIKKQIYIHTHSQIYFPIEQLNPTNTCCNWRLLRFRGAAEVALIRSIITDGATKLFPLADARTPSTILHSRIYLEINSQIKRRPLNDEKKKITKRRLVEDGEKDEKPHSPRGFLANDGINTSDGFLGGEGRNSVAQNPKLESGQQIFKEKRELYTPAHTRTIKAFIY